MWIYIDRTLYSKMKQWRSYDRTNTNNTPSCFLFPQNPNFLSQNQHFAVPSSSKILRVLKPRQSTLNRDEEGYRTKFHEQPEQPVKKERDRSVGSAAEALPSFLSMAASSRHDWDFCEQVVPRNKSYCKQSPRVATCESISRPVQGGSHANSRESWEEGPGVLSSCRVDFYRHP